ncbi:hypothetical protein ACWDKQ_07460 [Saccharopolyspora sp. NPDC000995]
MRKGEGLKARRQLGASTSIVGVWERSPNHFPTGSEIHRTSVTMPAWISDGLHRIVVPAMRTPATTGSQCAIRLRRA